MITHSIKLSLLSLNHDRLSLLILLFAAVETEAEPLPINFEQISNNCFIDYLKGISFLDAKYPKHNETANVTVDCNELISSAREKAYTEVAVTIRKDKVLTKHSKCMMKELRINNWFELILKLVVFEGANYTSEVEKNLKIAEADNATDQILDGAGVHCINAKEFGPLFDRFFTAVSSSSEEDDDVIIEYCAKKYLIDRNLIDTDFYKIDLNATNNIVRCDAIMDKTKKEFYDEIKEGLSKGDDDETLNIHQIDCAMKKYHEAKLFDKSLGVTALSDRTMSDEQKNKERRQFIDRMASITSTFVSCGED